MNKILSIKILTLFNFELADIRHYITENKEEMSNKNTNKNYLWR